MLWRFLLASVATVVAISAAPPNIVLIVSDDQGWNDVSYHGSEVRTPNIDRLAREGAELDRFYVSPVCSPTRAGLMTGRYPIRFGMQRAVCRPFLEVGVPPEEEILPEMLAGAGYKRRGAVGKWHIGHSHKRYHPLRQGFTSYYGHYNGNIDYFTHFREGELDWHRGFEPSFDEGYSTDLIADEAARFIGESTAEEPFFLYVAFNAPHAPMQVPPKWLDAYADISDETRRTNAAMIACLDAGIGRILDALDKAGEAENTLVWFMSDNGAGPGSNHPLRAGKGTMYEGGIRVPAAVRWPGKIEPERKIDAMLTYLDVWPTLRAAAEMEANQRPGRPLDGVNALDLLLGKVSDVERQPFYSYYERYAAESLAVIDGEWKLVRNGPPILGVNPADAPPPGTHKAARETLQVELFNLSTDPLEQEDVSQEHPEIVERLLAQLEEFRRLRPEGGVPPMTAPFPPGWKAPKQWEMK